MASEYAETLQGVATIVQDAPKRSEGKSVGKKRKHRGGYDPKSHQRHPGVSIVKRRGSFWIKWRIDFRAGVYRYEWQRLPETVTSRETARKHAKRKSDELTAKKQQTKHRRKGTKHLLPVPTGIDAYLDYLENERRERGADFMARARKQAEHHLKPFVMFVAGAGVKRCEKLTIDDIRDFRNSLGKTGLKNKSINRALDAARAALNYMADDSYIPFEAREIGKALKHYEVRQEQPRILNRAELKRLLKSLAERDGLRCQSSRKDKSAYHDGRQSETAKMRYKPLAPFVVMALLTGARPGEIESIMSEHVNIEHGFILIRDEKNNRDRTVPLHDSPLLRELVQVLKARAGAGAVVGKVKRARVNTLGLSAGIGITTTTDDDGTETEKSDLNRQMLRRTCIAHVASGSPDSEYLLETRFGHEKDVSARFYRQPLHGVRNRGATVEAWLGIEPELRELLKSLGYLNQQPDATAEGARA